MGGGLTCFVKLSVGICGIGVGRGVFLVCVSVRVGSKKIRELKERKNGLIVFLCEKENK